MNVENILKTAEAIEKDLIKGLKFNMTDFYHEMSCGTRACIGGYAVAVKMDVEEAPSEEDIQAYLIDNNAQGFKEDAQEFFGLDEETATSLMTPRFDVLTQRHLYDLAWNADRARAARVLRHLAKTGVVDWTVGESVGERDEEKEPTPTPH
jgi:hypothetical protein